MEQINVRVEGLTVDERNRIGPKKKLTETLGEKKYFFLKLDTVLKDPLPKNRPDWRHTGANFGNVIILTVINWVITQVLLVQKKKKIVDIFGLKR